MQYAFSRIRIARLAASSLLSVTAVATATTTVGHVNPTAAETAALLAGPTTKLLTRMPAARSAARIASLPGASLGTPAPRSYADLAALPPSGVVVSFKVTEPHNPQLTAFRLARIDPAMAESRTLAFSRFNKPGSAARPILLARLPQLKPAVSWPRDRGAESSPVMAYAAAPTGLEAPFELVMGRLRGSETADIDGLYRPRARPDPEPLLAWLKGRALGQFASGQHAWVRNPLPASVHEAKQQECLAEAIYFEARGESEDGQAAVAQVVLNRVRAPAYPDTICGVVYQNERWRNRCQFSFACDGRAERISSPASYATAQRIAREVTEGKIWLDDVGDSTHYHANYVRPRWGRVFKKADRIGAHIFYRTRFGGWS